MMICLTFPGAEKDERIGRNEGTDRAVSAGISTYYNGIICGCIGGDGCPARLFANESGYMELLVGENE